MSIRLCVISRAINATSYRLALLQLGCHRLLQLSLRSFGRYRCGDALAARYGQAGKCRNPEKRDARSLITSLDVAQADVALNAVVRRL